LSDTVVAGEEGSEIPISLNVNPHDLDGSETLNVKFDNVVDGAKFKIGDNEYEPKPELLR